MRIELFVFFPSLFSSKLKCGYVRRSGEEFVQRMILLSTSMTTKNVETNVRFNSMLKSHVHSIPNCNWNKKHTHTICKRLIHSLFQTPSRPPPLTRPLRLQSTVKFRNQLSPQLLGSCDFRRVCVCMSIDDGSYAFHYDVLLLKLHYEKCHRQSPKRDTKQEENHGVNSKTTKFDK